MQNPLQRLLERLYLSLGAPILNRVGQLRRDVDSIKIEVGRLHSRLLETSSVSSLADAEFRVFSQFGDDGIIQYLTQRIPSPERNFVEFGVEDYRQSNTRYLAEIGGWSGLILDGGTRHIEFVKERGLDATAGIRAETVFVTAENINNLFELYEVPSDLTVLSVDIDGVDYWVLDALSVTQPRVLIVEYNSMFGPNAAVTVPYRPDFDRGSAHFSHLYFGASLAAMCHLAERKGYVFVGSNSAGVNAYFVRADVAGSFQRMTPEEGWVRTRYRESRGPNGETTFLDPHSEGLALLRHLPLVDVTSGATTTVGQVYGT